MFVYLPLNLLAMESSAILLHFGARVLQTPAYQGRREPFQPVP